MVAPLLFEPEGQELQVVMAERLIAAATPAFAYLPLKQRPYRRGGYFHLDLIR
jgi:hypothetical protein